MDSRALVIHALKKTYPNGTDALRGVSLSIPQGELFALLGPNGAGKTTLIGIVTGLTNKTSGEVSVFGVSIDEDHDKAKSYIGLVPQEMNFNIFETVLNIVCTQGGYYGLPRKVAEVRAEKYLTALGLWEKRNDKSRTLSGGMKRRLMIARALVHEPELLILDEPTAGVDVELRRGMYDFLRELVAKGKTIILTTHYLEEAEELARDVAIVNKGEVVAQGPVKKLLATIDATSYILETAVPVDVSVLGTLANYLAVVRDDGALEVTTTAEAPLGTLVATLERAGALVTSARPKGNRLEEYFVRITKECDPTPTATRPPTTV